MDVLKELEAGKQAQGENRQMAKRLKKRKPKKLDDVVHQLHEKVFSEVDCLDCANCCKTTSPGMHDRDVDRLAKHLRVKSSALIEQYMELDTEGEYVFRSAPCPFLGADNYCSVYEARPLACREYPHTNRKRFYQVIDLSLKNTEICPAVVRIFDQMKQHF